MGGVGLGDYQVVETSRTGVLDVWEPLATRAPGPHLAHPYCCYRDTVIFYWRPYVLRPWHSFWIDNRERRRAQAPGSNWLEWDRVRHRLTWDSPIEYRGHVWLCGGGQVRWRGKGLGWWMKYSARGKQ